MRLALAIVLLASIAHAQFQSSLGSRSRPLIKQRTDVLDACSPMTLGHLVCDGAYDNAAALQGMINAQSTAARPYTIAISGKVGIASSVTLKANTVLTGNGSGQLKALTGATTLLTSSATIDNINIDGLTFDLNTIATARAVAMTGTTTNISFTNNLVKNPATGADSAHYLVEIRCGTLAGEAPCRINGNTIKGSDTAAKNDTCLAVLANGLIAADPATIVSDNTMYNCGAACLEMESGWTGAIINGNSLNTCKTTTTGAMYLQGGTFGTGVVTNNQIYTATGDGIYGPNLVNVLIQSNHIQGAGVGKFGVHVTATNSAGGLRMIGNYLTQGVWADAKGTCATGANNCAGAIGTYGAGCTCDQDADCQNTDCGTYGTFDHIEASHNILSYTSSPAGIPTNFATLTFENVSNLNVIGNTDISTTTTAITRAGIKIANYGGATTVGQLNVSSNILKLTKTAGTIYGIWITRPEGTASTNDLTLYGNYLGTTDVGIEVDNTPAGTGWYIKNNNASNTTTGTVGLPGNIDFAIPIDDMPGFRGIDRNIVCARDQAVAAASTLVAMRCNGSGTDPVSYGTVDTAVGPAMVGDFVSGEQSYTQITTTTTTPGSGDNAGFVWPSATATPVGVQRGWRPLLTAVMRTPATITSGRWWCGWFSDTTTAPGSNDPSGTAGVAWRFDTATDTSTWRAWSNDGTTTGTATDSAITFAASTKYVFEIDCSNTLGATPDCKFFVNGKKAVTRTTELPVSTTNLGFLCGVTTLTTATRAMELGSFKFTYPF